MRTNLSFLPAFSFLLSSFVSAAPISDPCGGPSALLSLVNRPTVGDSACVVPYRQILIETGYQYTDLTHSQGSVATFPQAVVRIGLPFDNELVILSPSYNRQSLPGSGSSATSLGVKHEIGYNEKWLGSVESLFVLPNGSATYGSQGLGAAINGIVTYSFSKEWLATYMMGVVTATMPTAAGGQRYTTLNPDLVIAYTPTERLSVYVENYGYTQAGPGQGFATAIDVGALYLLTPNWEADVIVGHRTSGNLFGLNSFVGAGMSFLF